MIFISESKRPKRVVCFFTKKEVHPKMHFFFVFSVGIWLTNGSPFSLFASRRILCVRGAKQQRKGATFLPFVFGLQMEAIFRMTTSTHTLCMRDGERRKEATFLPFEFGLQMEVRFRCLQAVAYYVYARKRSAPFDALLFNAVSDLAYKRKLIFVACAPSRTMCTWGKATTERNDFLSQSTTF